MARAASSVALYAIVALAAVSSAAAGNEGDAAAAAAKKPPRGVDPAAGAAYLQPTFVCDGGATTLDSSKINDEYCDCKDGTDEPGACLRAHVRVVLVVG